MQLIGYFCLSSYLNCDCSNQHLLIRPFLIIVRLSCFLIFALMLSLIMSKDRNQRWFTLPILQVLFILIPWHRAVCKMAELLLLSILFLNSTAPQGGESNGTPLQYSCLENPMDRGAWKAVVHGVAEGRTRLSDFTFTFHFHALEKEMATHSSVLAWRIPGMGEPGGVLSMGSHRLT